MTIVLIGIIILLCLFPALAFLGLWYGLTRMQRSSLITRTTERADCTDPTVTWGDVFDAYTDPQKNLFSTSPNSKSQSSPPSAKQCSVCAAENDPFVSFCHNCFQKLK